MKDYLLNHAVMTAYRRLIEARRYPAVVLGLDVVPGDVDVNVHPAKMEVRFRNPRGIYALIVESLSGAIGAGLTAAVAGTAVSSGAGGSGYASRVEDALKRYRVSSGSGKTVLQRVPSRKKRVRRRFRRSSLGKRPGQSEPAGDQHCFSDLHYIGQTAGTYLIFTGEEGMVLVDQHAAHERVLFEKLRRQAQGEKAVGQRLLLPEVVSLPPRDMVFLTEVAPILEEAGMEVEPFGGDSVVIKTIPAFLSHTEARTLLLDLLADCTESGSRSSSTGKTGEDLYGPGLPGRRQGEPRDDRSGGGGALP